MQQEEFNACIVVERAPEIMKDLFGDPVKELPPDDFNSKVTNHPDPEKYLKD